nr:protein kinase-like domain, phloem protein 2-like protein [Tanacetum cinerariifolium]
MHHESFKVIKSRMVHEQVVEDEKLSDDLHWTFNEEYMYINLLKWFLDNGREGYSVDRNGKKCLKLSTRGVIRSDKLSFMPLPESRSSDSFSSSTTCSCTYEM